jgi:hypothetical protein
LANLGYAGGIKQSSESVFGLVFEFTFVMLVLVAQVSLDFIPQLLIRWAFWEITFKTKVGQLPIKEQ